MRYWGRGGLHFGKAASFGPCVLSVLVSVTVFNLPPFSLLAPRVTSYSPCQRVAMCRHNSTRDTCFSVSPPKTLRVRVFFFRRIKFSRNARRRHYIPRRRGLKTGYRRRSASSSLPSINPRKGVFSSWEISAASTRNAATRKDSGGRGGGRGGGHIFVCRC